MEHKEKPCSHRDNVPTTQTHKLQVRIEPGLLEQGVHNSISHVTAPLQDRAWVTILQTFQSINLAVKLSTFNNHKYLILYKLIPFSEEFSLRFPSTFTFIELFVTMLSNAALISTAITLWTSHLHSGYKYSLILKILCLILPGSILLSHKNVFPAFNRVL